MYIKMMAVDIYKNIFIILVMIEDVCVYVCIYIEVIIRRYIKIKSWLLEIKHSSGGCFGGIKVSIFQDVLV